MSFLNKVAELLNQILIWLAGGLLCIMVILTCANIFFRVTWVPIPGTFELMGYLSAVATAFALGYAQLKKTHIWVDVLVQRFSNRTQRILTGVNAILCTAFFAIVAWQIIRYGTTLRTTGEVTETLRIIYYPFTYAVALGCAALSLVFLVEFLNSFRSSTEEES
jgi:TRAP-type C4-dicarboxylate transport system permease small subunit